MAAQALAETIDQVPVSVLRLVAVPAPGDVSTYARLTEIELAAYALWLRIIQYRAIPAHPENADYRRNRMEHIEADIFDMRKALGNG